MFDKQILKDKICVITGSTGILLGIA